MLFNSYEYLLIFLPVVVFVFYRIGAKGHHRVAIAWLVIASLFFYGWWNPAYLGLIIASMLGNYAVGIMLSGRESQNRTALLVVGVAANLAALGYYKYSNFIVGNINKLLSFNIQSDDIILPLAISFFTFQQIAYLVDAYKGYTREYNFLHYCLFVTFFPQLIAGPIVHHKEMLPQFANNLIYRINWTNIVVGLTILSLGLFKKVVLADNIAGYANQVFTVADNGAAVGFHDGWIGALAYTLQLYFDFSGYADMAIGSARLFGIILPLNFNSPYKSTSIIGFWRCWHMTLSRFLRDYLYIPLGGNRRGPLRRYINLFITMLLGGLWHGAGWTFIVWGALHGVYLVINHFWHWILNVSGFGRICSSRFYIVLSWLLTFLAIVVGWVFFRAETFTGATTILAAMFDPGSAGSILHSATGILANQGTAHTALVWIAVLLFITLALPSTQDLMSVAVPALEFKSGEWQASWSLVRLSWYPSRAWALLVGAVMAVSIVFMLAPTEFLYWQF